MIWANHILTAVLLALGPKDTLQGTIRKLAKDDGNSLFNDKKFTVVTAPEDNPLPVHAVQVETHGVTVENVEPIGVRSLEQWAGTAPFHITAGARGAFHVSTSLHSSGCFCDNQYCAPLFQGHCSAFFDDAATDDDAILTLANTKTEVAGDVVFELTCTNPIQALKLLPRYANDDGCDIWGSEGGEVNCNYDCDEGECVMEITHKGSNRMTIRVGQRSGEGLSYGHKSVKVSCEDTMTLFRPVWKPSYRVFVLTVNGGNLGGLDGADNKCQAAAIEANLPGEYKAWLSDGSSDPAQRFEHHGGCYRAPNRVPIAKDWDDLTTCSDEDGQCLENWINTDAYGSGLGGDLTCDFVFTNTWPDGNLKGILVDEHHCNSWTSNDPSKTGWTGIIDFPNRPVVHSWTDNGLESCNSNKACIYCFQQTDTYWVPSTYP